MQIAKECKDINECLRMLEHPDTDYRKISENIQNFSIKLRTKKTIKLVKELTNILTKAEEQGVLETYKLSLNDCGIVKSLDSLVKLNAKLYTNKKLDEKEYRKRAITFDTLYKDFEFNLRTYFDSAESTLNALALNIKNDQNFLSIVMTLRKANIITPFDVDILRAFGQIRNTFMHNDPSQLLNPKYDYNVMLYKALFIKTHEIITMLVNKFRFRILMYGARVKYSEYMERPLSERPDDITKRNITVVQDSYRRMMETDKKHGINFHNYILTPELLSTYDDYLKKHEQYNLNKEIAITKIIDTLKNNNYTKEGVKDVIKQNLAAVGKELDEEDYKSVEEFINIIVRMNNGN